MGRCKSQSFPVRWLISSLIGPIAFTNGRISGAGRASNLAVSGCTVVSDTGVSPGVHVQMELRLYLPEGVMPVDVDQAVVRWARGLAFEVEFLAMQLGEQERLRRFVDTLRQEPSVTDRIIQTVAENPECQLADVLHACPDLTWNQIFSEVDHLSRSGQVRLRQESAGVYTLSLPGN